MRLSMHSSRRLNPLEAKLLVADISRSDNTFTLAVSPAQKAIGVPGDPRLFEAKQAIRRAEIECSHEIKIHPAYHRGWLVCAHIIGNLFHLILFPRRDIHVYSMN